MRKPQHKIMYVRKPHNVKPGRSKAKLARWALNARKRQKGGFFPLLAPLIPAIVSGLGALATGAAGATGAWAANKAIKAGERNAAQKKAKQAKARKYVIAQQKRMIQMIKDKNLQKQRRIRR